MRNLTIKIAVIFIVFLISIIAILSIFILLVNNGKLTFFIEQQIYKKTDLDIKIGDIHINVFSGLTLKQVTLQDLKIQRGSKFACKTLIIDYTPVELLKGRIKRIEFLDVQTYFETEGTNLTSLLASSNSESHAISIKDLFPKNIHIENIFVRNSEMEFKTGNRILLFSEVSVLINDLQSIGQSEFSINGKFSTSNHTRDISSSVPGEFALKGNYSISDDELNLYDTSRFSVNNFGSLNLGGKVVSITTEPAVNCIVNSRNIALGNIPIILKKLDIKALPSLTLEGECDINFSIQGNSEKLRIKSNNLIKNLNVTTETMNFKAKEFELPIETIFSHTDPESKINADGKFVIRQGHLWIENGELMTLDFPVTFNMNYPSEITLFSNAIEGELLLGNIRYPIKDLISSIKIDIDLKHQDNIRLYTAINTTFSDSAFLAGKFNRNKKTIRDITLNIQNIDCKTLSNTFKSLIPENYKEWSYNGSVSVSTTLNLLDKGKDQEMKANTSVSFSELKFASPDYDYFGERINGQLKINANIDQSFERFSFLTNGTIEPFLIQLGTFTTDMKNRKTNLSFNGYCDTQKRLLSEIKGIISWRDLGAITIEGDALNLTHNTYLDMNIEMKRLSNMAFFDTFVKDTIQYSYPAFFNSSIDGESNAQFHITGFKDVIHIDGHINMKGLNFVYDDGSVEDLNIDLPISITYPQTTVPTKKHDISDLHYGTIKIKRLSYGPLEIKDIQTNPVIISNNLYIKAPLRISFFDGAVDIEDVFVEDIINPDRKINFTFQLNNINMEKITNTYKLTPFEGNLSSSIISFRQEGDKLNSEGKMKIKIFDGDITISDLALTNFLEPLMGIEFSAEIDHLDLGQMSNTFHEWGNITGIINGYIKDFRLVAREPSSFEIELKTKRHSRVKQIVSTKFLKNFVPGVGKVLDKLGFTNYKYAVMGLYAKLENDYVTLQGAVREDGKELFMKGEGLKKLEVVFQDAHRKIPFRSFLNSFKGILGSDFKDTHVQFQ